MNLNKYFLPYQLEWLNNSSRIKLWEKSRRIGATYVQSFEDVRDCILGTVPAVWFSSSDITAASEYIGYAEKWSKLFNVAAKSIGEQVIDSENNIKALVIEFSNKTKIHALSSNPKGYRSKGGKIVLDEFAFHDNPLQLWQAARPCITWGYPLRILSTHNGQSCLFYQFVENIKNEKLNWSMQTTPIQMAVEQGLVDKIYGRPTTEEERQAWIDEERANCFDEYTWMQEYCCIACDETTAFLPYELITPCEAEGILLPINEIKGDIYVGMDIGRKKDLTVIWIIEALDRFKITRQVLILEKMPFHLQQEILFEVLSHPRLRRCCIDGTGLGMQLAETAQRKYGKHRVESISFTNKIKEELAYGMRTNFENKTILIPKQHEIREDFHSIRRLATNSGNIRFDVQHSDVSGHADRFWGCSLALHASDNQSGPIHIVSRQRFQSLDISNLF